MTIDALIALYEGDAGRRPYDEVVSEVAHALQCAELALDARAPDALVAAALLHDVGHLLASGSAHTGVATDDRHEESGARHLRRWFGPDVTAPVSLHVAAKRYLCATDADHLALLSPASRHSLGLQGGPMTPDEAAAFERRPHAQDAVLLRGWDDAAKAPDAIPRPMAEHRALLLRVASAT